MFLKCDNMSLFCLLLEMSHAAVEIGFRWVILLGWGSILVTSFTAFIQSCAFTEICLIIKGRTSQLNLKTSTEHTKTKTFCSDLLWSVTRLCRGLHVKVLHFFKRKLFLHMFTASFWKCFYQPTGCLSKWTLLMCVITHISSPTLKRRSSSSMCLSDLHPRYSKSVFTAQLQEALRWSLFISETCYCFQQSYEMYLMHLYTFSFTLKSQTFAKHCFKS